MPVRNLLILLTTATASLVCYHTASRNHYANVLAAAIGQISETFVRPIDQRRLFEGAMDGMAQGLDPYSDYISPEELTQFQEDLDQKFGGIGIVVEMKPNGQLTVLSPLPDTPAFEAGMRAGDVILAIDGEVTEGFQIQDAVDRMRGEPGTKLTVTVLHLGETEPVDLELRRAVIPIASVLGDVRNPDGSWQFKLREHPEIGYIRVASFGEKTVDELRETLQSLGGRSDGLILDLRDNGGGLLSAAVDVCDLFIDQGTIVSIRGRKRSDWRDYEASPPVLVPPSLPLVVLVNRYSASASEIAAGCLKDHDRAIIVGERTWGKGTVQNVMPFEGGRSALKLTVATYWRPNGKNIHRPQDATEEDDWGVSPTAGYEVKLTEEEFRKVQLLRQRRDQVELESEDSISSPESSSTPAESSDATDAAPESSGSTDASSQPPSPSDRRQVDLTGFEDPQRRRAIEALRNWTGAPTEPEG